MSVKRPTGVTIIAVLTFCGAAILALSSFGFFLIAVMGTTSKDGRQPVSAAIDGMGVAGGFSLLVLASVAACLAIGVLKLCEWARIVSIASVAAGIGCTIFSIFAFWSYSDCRDDRFPSACDGDGCLDADVLGAPASEAGLSRYDRVKCEIKGESVHNWTEILLLND